jgi:hypothetical protein
LAGQTKLEILKSDKPTLRELTFDLHPVNRTTAKVSFQVKGENSHEAKTIYRRTDHRDSQAG